MGRFDNLPLFVKNQLFFLEKYTFFFYYWWEMAYLPRGGYYFFSTFFGPKTASMSLFHWTMQNVGFYSANMFYISTYLDPPPKKKIIFSRFVRNMKREKLFLNSFFETKQSEKVQTSLIDDKYNPLLSEIWIFKKIVKKAI